VEERRVRVISLSSPLGQALVELEEGESAEVETPRGLVEVEVISVV
jgi:transcription elongation GreA/GreB family factor